MIKWKKGDTLKHRGVRIRYHDHHCEITSKGPLKGHMFVHHSEAIRAINDYLDKPKPLSEIMKTK